MNVSRHRKVASVLFACMAGSCFQAFSDGYRNPPPTAEGIAKAGAHSVFVDDASAISYNPANLGLQKDQSLVIAATFARTVNEYSPAPGISIESDNSWNVLPNIFYSLPLGDKIAAGIGITTPYGQGSRWNASDLVNRVTGVTDFIPYEAEVLLININPSAGFKISDNLYLGAGINVVYSELTLKALAPNPFIPDPFSPIPVEGEGDGWGIGANAGLTWLPAQGQRVALTCRSRYDIDYEGDSSLGGNFETEIRYPNSVGLGYGISLGERFEVEALVEWMEWSVNDSQTVSIGGPPVIIENNWDDTVTASIGGGWQILDSLTVRAGYSYIPSPIPDEAISPLLVDADRHVLGIGLGCSIGNHMFDLSYAFSFYDERTRPFAGDPTEPAGDYKIDSNLLGVTYLLNF